MRERVVGSLLVLPLIVCGILDIDSWPFSNFPMYSFRFRVGAFTQYGLFRVKPDGSSREVRSSRLLWPINFQRLQALATKPSMQVRLEDYVRRWHLQSGERLQLRELRIRLVVEGDQLHQETLSAQVRLEAVAP